jgi:hypothetical protein
MSYWLRLLASTSITGGNKMKKMLFIVFLCPSLFIGNAFSEETPNAAPVAGPTSTVPSRVEHGTINPVIQASPNKEKALSPRVIDLRKKSQGIAPVVVQGHPINNRLVKPAEVHPIVQVKPGTLVPHEKAPLHIVPGTLVPRKKAPAIIVPLDDKHVSVSTPKPIDAK